jgi:putative transposase
MTQLMTIAPGTRVERNGKQFVITNLLDLEAVLAKDTESGRPERLFIKDLTPAKPEKVKEPQEEGTKQKTDIEIALVEDSDWQEAQKRFALIQPLLIAPTRSRLMVKEAADRYGVHTTTVYRWMSLYESTGRVSSLLPPTRDGGRGRSRLTRSLETIIRTTIEDFYLDKQQRTMQKTCDEVERRCKNAGIEPPHPNTVRNRITALTDRVKLERRCGKKAAQKYTPAVMHFPGADWPLSVVQIDHTKLDIILVDDDYRRSIGRPWITLAMDVFSRMVVGYYIAFDPPGALSTGLCISHAILPKEKWLEKFGITTSWPCWGIPKTIHLDNAREFRGKMLKRACEEHGIDLEWRPVATPHWGGHIERLLGTFLREIHTLPGTTFSNTRQRGEYNSEKEAVFTISEFEKWFAIFVVEVYHQRYHTALKKSPIKQFELGIFGTEARPGVGLLPKIIDETRVQLDFMPYEERTVQTYGVVIDEIHYYEEDVLRRFINARDPQYPTRKQQFIFKRDPRNISVIHFFDPEVREYFPIPYRNTSHPAISLWELRAVRKQLEREGKNEINEDLIFEAYERMRAAEESAIARTKHARRWKQRRTEHERSQISGLLPVESESQSFHEHSLDAETCILPFDETEELI